MPLLAPLFVWLGAGLKTLAVWGSGFLVMAGGSFLVTAAVPLAKKVLIGLGFGFVVYQGLDILFEQASNAIRSQVLGLPVDLLDLLSWLQVDSMISLIFSAYSVRLALTLGANSGVLKKI